MAMLRETVCYVNRPGVTLMRRVKALSEGRKHERMCENVDRVGQKNTWKKTSYFITLSTFLILDIILS